MDAMKPRQYDKLYGLDTGPGDNCISLAVHTCSHTSTRAQVYNSVSLSDVHHVNDGPGSSFPNKTISSEVLGGEGFVIAIRNLLVMIVQNSLVHF